MEVALGLPADSARLDARAFKKLYPDQYYDRFIVAGVRPDGRALAGFRPTTVGLRAVTSSEASALVKVGRTTVLGSIKLETMIVEKENPQQGELRVLVELAAIASAELRPGRPSDAAQVLTEQVRSTLIEGGAIDLEALMIGPGPGAWVLYLDLYVLDSDGALLDACLLSAVGALTDLVLPSVAVQPSGVVVAVNPEDTVPEGSAVVEARPLQIRQTPLSLTCMLYKEHLVTDPTADEEALGSAVIIPIMTAGGQIVGLHEGGKVEASTQRLIECIEAAKIRHKELTLLLKQAVADLDA